MLFRMARRSGVPGRRTLLLATVLAALVALGPAAGSAGAVKLTFIGDSKAAGIEYSAEAKRLLADLRTATEHRKGYPARRFSRWTDADGDRCATPLIEPSTLESGKEPLRTLARHRKRLGRTWFGPDFTITYDDIEG